MHHMAASFLIDGYNLLHASDVFASNAGPPTLERTRTALLDSLATALDERQRRRTTIVFDAAQAPPGLPHEFTFAGMKICFSRRPQHADDLLEDLLAAAKGPREILLVSSDHRVQRAARQRGAAFIDSEIWWSDLKRNQTVAVNDEQKPDCASHWETSPEIEQWLKAFSGAKVDAAPLPLPHQPVSDTPPPDKPVLDHWNPFPPGYGEDLLPQE